MATIAEEWQARVIESGKEGSSPKDRVCCRTTDREKLRNKQFHFRMFFHRGGHL